MGQYGPFERATVCRRAQAARDDGPGPAAGFQIAGKALDVGTSGPEQAQVAHLAPGGELPQIR